VKGHPTIDNLLPGGRRSTVTQKERHIHQIGPSVDIIAILCYLSKETSDLSVICVPPGEDESRLSSYMTRMEEAVSHWALSVV
jgi:hypothetical protein